SVSSGRLNPPGIAHLPANGGTPRRTSSACNAPPATVSTTTSTVTAKAGWRPGSKAFAVRARVLVDMTVTLAQGYGHCDENSDRPATEGSRRPARDHLRLRDFIGHV